MDLEELLFSASTWKTGHYHQCRGISTAVCRDRMRSSCNMHAAQNYSMLKSCT